MYLYCHSVTVESHVAAFILNASRVRICTSCFVDFVSINYMLSVCYSSGVLSTLSVLITRYLCDHFRCFVDVVNNDTRYPCATFQVFYRLCQ